MWIGLIIHGTHWTQSSESSNISMPPKVKIFEVGHYYINRVGDFSITLLGGDNKRGYTFFASHASPHAFLGKIRTLSRYRPNDGNWIEIDNSTFRIASEFHMSGHVTKVHPSGKVLPSVSKMY